MGTSGIMDTATVVSGASGVRLGDAKVVAWTGRAVVDDAGDIGWTGRETCVLLEQVWDTKRSLVWEASLLTFGSSATGLANTRDLIWVCCDSPT